MQRVHLRRHLRRNRIGFRLVGQRAGGALLDDVNEFMALHFVRENPLARRIRLEHLRRPQHAEARMNAALALETDREFLAFRHLHIVVAERRILHRLRLRLRLDGGGSGGAWPRIGQGLEARRHLEQPVFQS